MPKPIPWIAVGWVLWCGFMYLYFPLDRVTGFGGIAVKKPAFVQQLDLAPVFFVISLHELMAEPLRQEYPSSAC